MFSFCIIMINVSLVESFSKYSALVKIVYIKAQKENVLHFRLYLCTIHKISCQQAHPATVKFLIVVAKYHILILKS